MKKIARRLLLGVASRNPQYRIALRGVVRLDGSLNFDRLIRIAYANPDLQSDLLPILREAANQPGRRKGKAEVSYLVWTIDAKDPNGGALLQKRPGIRSSRKSIPAKWFIPVKDLKERLKRIEDRKRRRVLSIANRAGIAAVRKRYKAWFEKNWETPWVEGEDEGYSYEPSAEDEDAFRLQTVNRVLGGITDLKPSHKPTMRDRRRIERLKKWLENGPQRRRDEAAQEEWEEDQRESSGYLKKKRREDYRKTDRYKERVKNTEWEIKEEESTRGETSGPSQTSKPSGAQNSQAPSAQDGQRGVGGGGGGSAQRLQMGEDNTFTDVYIHEFSLQSFFKKIEMLTRKAKKLGLQPPIATQTREEKVPEYVYGSLIVAGYSNYHIFDIQHSELKIEGGWEFLGSIQHMKGGNVLRVFVGDEESGQLGLDRYRKAESNCDHCNKKRKRNDTYIVRSSEGQVLQVGKSCLKDFLGHNAARDMGWMQKVEGDLISLEKGGPMRHLTKNIIAYSRGLIKEYGWVSKSGSLQEGSLPTSARLYMLTSISIGQKGFKEAAEEMKVYLGKYLGFATDALDWARSISESSTSVYLKNLRAVASEDQMNPRNLGLVGSIAFAYDRAMQKDFERARVESPESLAIAAGPLGKPDDKIGGSLTPSDRRRGRATWLQNGGKLVRVENTNKTTLKGTGLVVEGIDTEIIFVKEIENDYGLSTIIKMQAPTGHMFTWFKSGELDDDFDRGTKITMSGTIKKHDSFNGVPQTMLTRCTLALR